MPLVQTIQLAQAATQSPGIVMQDTSAGTGWGIYSTRAVVSEYVGSSSALVGKLIDSITVNIKKSSSSASGTAYVGIINPDLSMKKVFASISISTLTTSYTPREFKLVGGSYLIQAGDRIGVKYTGGTSSSNYLSIMRDTNSAGPYDGTKTYLSYFTTSWTAQTTNDLTMTLKYSGPAIDATPPSVVASPAGGIYNSARMVALTSNEPATIFYTIDNTTPTTTSSAYSSPISISSTTTLKFFGKDTAGNAGSVVSVTYTIDSTAPAVTASPSGGTYPSAQSVSLTSNEAGTVIYYTINGADPGSSSPIYSSPIQVISTTTLKFYGKDAAGNFGSIISKNYVIDTTAPTVTASPPAGSYNTAQSVILTADDPAATIYYTTDGTALTTFSPVYSEPILVSGSTTLAFFGVDAIGNTGIVATRDYTIDMVAPIVTASPAGGTYSSVQSVMLASSEPGTTIRYTTNGNPPNDSSLVYASPIALSSDTVLNFFSKDTAGNVGTLVSETYLITVPDTMPPTVSASPRGGIFGPSGTRVELTSSEPGTTTIYYTLDNGIPDATGSVYTSPILISASTTLRFVGVDAAGNSGNIVTEVYAVDNTGPNITASPSGGIFTSGQPVTLSADESGTSIYYTTDGTNPGTSSPTFAAPININSDLTLKFYGIDSFGNVGPVATEVYDIQSATLPPPDGVFQIYPTKQGGDEWYMNADSPASDPRFNPKTTITKNADGSWKIKSSQVRANVFTTTGYSQSAITTYNQNELAAKGYMQSPNDWKNVEVTGYIKVNAFSTDDNFVWYGRGGMHTGSEECEGTAYKGGIYYSGKSRFAKEQWHSGGYSYSTTKTVADPIKGKWVGIKFVMYNKVIQQGDVQITAVKLETWIDAKNDGNWIKVDEKLDAGGWGAEGDNCGGSPDQIITWGGPVVTFRWDSATDADFKKFSVREIAPPQ